MEYWDSEEKLLLLQKCSQVIEKFRKIVCFYSNPKLPSALNMHSLNALTREMRNMIHSFSPIHYHLEPATTKKNITEALDRYKPDVVAFSAHATNNRMVLEDENGRPDLVTAEDFTNMILTSTVGHHPSCILLLACDTLGIAETLSDAFPDTCIMFWSSFKVEDRAAQFFTQQFFEKLSTILDEKDLSVKDYIECWGYSVKMFSKHFEIQDPQEFLKHKQMPPDIVRGIPAYMLNGILKKASITSPSTPTKESSFEEKPPHVEKKVSITSPHTYDSEVVKRKLTFN